MVAKGSNENFDGILRQFFPKKTDFGKVSNQELERVLRKIKNRSRKVLGYFKVTDIFWEKIKWCIRHDTPPIDTYQKNQSLHHHFFKFPK